MQTNAFVKHNRSPEIHGRKRHNGGHGSDVVTPISTVDFRATEGLSLAGSRHRLGSGKICKLISFVETLTGKQTMRGTDCMAQDEKIAGTLLTPLGIPGSAYVSGAAVEVIDQFNNNGIYAEGIDVFTIDNAGVLAYAYDEWLCHDYEGDDSEENLKRGSAQAKDFVTSYAAEDGGTALFRIRTRTTAEFE